LLSLYGRSTPAKSGGGGGKGDEANDVYKLVRMCKDKKFFPVSTLNLLSLARLCMRAQSPTELCPRRRHHTSPVQEEVLEHH
jgi:hypothetical protein